MFCQRILRPGKRFWLFNNPYSLGRTEQLSPNCTTFCHLLYSWLLRISPYFHALNIDKINLKVNSLKNLSFLDLSQGKAALYNFLKQVDGSGALPGAWFRLIYCAILGVAILNLVYVLLILSPDNTPAAQSDQLNAQVLLFITAFNRMWSFGLLVFGLHLLIIGRLVLKSGFIPKILGILLLLATVSYIIVHLLHVFFPQLEHLTVILENILSLPMGLGELVFAVWLLSKGGRTAQVAG